MKLDGRVIIRFKCDGKINREIEVTLQKLVESNEDDIYELLDSLDPCTSSSCNNESQNFCDCGSYLEDYEIFEVLFYNEILQRFI